MSRTNGIIAGIGDFGISQLVDEANDAKDLAVSAKNTAVSAKDTAVAKASEASASASTASTKASEASASATSANEALSQISQVGFQGGYNPATNTPALSATPSGALNDGAWYEISAPGTLGFATTEYISGQSVNTGDILRKKGTAWELRLLAQNSSKIASWVAQNYTVSSQVEKDGAIWKNPSSSALSTDIPGASVVWIPHIFNYQADKN